MAELQGKTAWVTGAGTGIGEAGALALARAGAAVVLTGRREEPLRRVAVAIEAAGGRALVEPGDMTDPAQIDRIVAAIRERLGRLDILVNNAGVNIRERRWAELNPARIDTVDDGNRSSVICPGEVATPILDHRPVPVSAEDRARMLQAEDLGDLILFVATRPKRVCINEVLIGPAWNRSYLRMRG